MSAWTATVNAHAVKGPVVSYDIPEMTFPVGGVTAKSAKTHATIHVHTVHKLPPWRPYLRQTWPHVSVVEHDELDRARRSTRK